jgi:phage terminase Nu1 subunit (DNA packaging protein)
MSVDLPTCRVATKVAVAEFFGVSPNAVEGWVRRGCPVMERGDLRKSYKFDLLKVAEWRFKPDQTGESSETDPEKLPPKERLDWYNGEKARRALQIQDGELLPAADVEVEWSSFVKTLVNFLDTLFDVLERDAGLTGAQIERGRQLVDRERERLYRQLTS